MEAEAVIVEGGYVNLPEVYVDRKDEATLRDVVTEEVLVPAVGAPQTGWRVDRSPQGPGRMRLVSTPLWSLRPPTREPEHWLIIGKAAQREMRAKWRADDRDAFAAQEERCSSWRRAKRGGVVACGVQGPLVDGGGELPGPGSAGDGHVCLPCAPARAINVDPVVTSEGGLLAQRARRRCDTCVETLVQQARAQITSSPHEHAFLELCCASDSELAALVVEHSVVIRVTSFEDVQLTSTRTVLHRLLMIRKAYEAYEVVANIWVFDPMHCCRAYVGLFRHAVRNAGGFSWEWINCSELWDLVVVRNLFARWGSSSRLVLTAAVGQQIVDRERGVFFIKMLEMFKKVTGAAHAHVFHHQLRAVEDNADAKGLNSSVQPYSVAVHSDSSWHAGENAFLRSAGNAVDAKFCKRRFVYINAWRNITTEPIENNYVVVSDEIYLVSPDDNLASDLFMPGARLMQYGLSNQNAAKHRWYYFPKMQMDEVLLFKQFELDTALPGRTTSNIAFVDPTVIPDALERQSIECRAFVYFLDFEPNTYSALSSDTVAKEVASHAEHGLWDLLRVRELSKCMRNDVCSEVFVGDMFVKMGMNFAEMAMAPAQFSAALSGFLLGCRTQQPQQQLLT